MILTGSFFVVVWTLLLLYLTPLRPVTDGIYYISETPTADSITTLEGKLVYLGPKCTEPVRSAEFYPTEEGDGSYIFRLYFVSPDEIPENDRLALCLGGRGAELGTISGFDRWGMNRALDFKFTLLSDRWFMTEAGTYFGITPWYWYPIHTFIRDYTSTFEDYVFVAAFVLLVCWLFSKTAIWDNMKRARSWPAEAISDKW